MTMARKPDFFIIGAQRCGTTSLSQNLSAHPNIVISAPKEPFFFATDFPRLRRMESEEEYLKIFRPITEATMAVGESTAAYLYSKSAVENIYRYNPEAKLIVMLRNPIDIVHSFHALHLYSLYEDEPNLKKAWALQEVRKNGQSIPKGCLVPEFLQYAEIGKLGDQVERLLNIFPPNQVAITFFEDFIRDNRQFYLNVLEFLNIPDDGTSEFPRLNESRKARFPLLTSLLSPRPRWMQRCIDRTKAGLGLKGQQWLQNLYGVPARREPLDPEFRMELAEFFRDDINKLSKLTRRDLSHWLIPPSQTK